MEGGSVIQHYVAAAYDAPPQDAQILRPYLERYRKSEANAEMVLGIIGTYTTARDAMFMLGGPEGMAVSGLLRATVDKIPTYAIEKQRDRESSLMAASIKSMTDQEFKTFKSNVSSKDPAVRQAAMNGLEGYVNEVLALQDTGDEKEGRALAKAAATLTTKTAIANLQSIEDLRKGQQLSRKEMQKLGVTLVKQQAELSAQVGQLDKKVVALSASVTSLERCVQGLALKSMTPKERAVALNSDPNYAGLTPDDHASMLKDATRDAVLQRAQDVASKAAGTVQGLAVIAGALGLKDAQKTLAQVSQAVQYGQAALSIFAGFATGGPIGGLMAIGSMGGMFGGGGGSSAELAQMSAKLEQIDRKLDRVLELQQLALSRIAIVSQQLEMIDAKIDRLEQSSRANAAKIMKAVLRTVYQGCQNTITSVQLELPTGERNLDLSSRPEDYVVLHFPLPNVTGRMRTKAATQCAAELAQIIGNPELLATAGGQERPGDQQTLLEAEAELSDRVKILGQYLPPHDGIAIGMRPEPYLSMSPTGTFGERYFKAIAARTFSASSPDPRPCRWITGARPAKCEVFKGPVDDQLNALLKVPDRTRLPVTAPVANLLSEYSLAMFAQPLLYQGKRNTAEHTDDALQILEGAARLLDIAVATTAAREGDVAVEFVADAALRPPALPSTDATMTAKCTPGVTLGEGFLGADQEWLYWQYPGIAEAVAQAVMYRLAFHGGQPVPESLGGSTIDVVGMPDQSSAAMYEYKRITAPFDWALPNPQVLNRQTIARAQRYWFGPPAPAGDDDSKLLNHIQIYYVTPGSKRVIKRAPLIERNTAITTGHQSPTTLEDKGKDCIGARTAPLDIGKQLPAAVSYLRMADPIELELPFGWSIVLGGTVVPFLPAAELAQRNIPLTSAMSSLITRRGLIDGELRGFRNKVPSEVLPFLRAGVQAELRPYLCPAQTHLVLTGDGAGGCVAQ